jgi:hypothetical protein
MQAESARPLLSLVSLAHLFLKEHSRYGACRALRKEAESNSTSMGLNMARTHIGGSFNKIALSQA